MVRINILCRIGCRLAFAFAIAVISLFSETAFAAAPVSVSITGSAQTRAGSTTQFVAKVVNVSSTGVTWRVDGIVNGSSLTGTISSTGIYTAPAVVPSPHTVTITATSVAVPTKSASLVESILNPVPVIISATATEVGGNQPVLLDVLGSSIVAGAQIQVNGVSVSTIALSSNELQAYTPYSSNRVSVAVDVVNPAPGLVSSAVSTVPINSFQVSFPTAARLLDQATFGPTLTDIAHVQKIGINAYLAEQFSATPTLMPTKSTNSTSLPGGWNPQQWMWSDFFQASTTANDQLRQRVAFALGHIFVISDVEDNIAEIPPFQNTLVNDAFGNFQDLLHDVTISAGMGTYLNMVNSAKAPAGQIANENYAREVMQLFTIGLTELNEDGTQQLDSHGNPIPTYTEAQVEAFARAFTGWTYAQADGSAPSSFRIGYWNANHIMVPVESAHDASAKILLNGTVLPPGQTAEQDVAAALANLFEHPNVGPFICRQLIQNLVTSNPSPAYVGRVAAVFANNGNGVRGDLKAVVTAILTDEEARIGDTAPTASGGHLREPILYTTSIVRALGYVNTDPNGFYGQLFNQSSTLGETIYGAPNVFGFYPSGYVLPGSAIAAPEFGIENTSTALTRLSAANNLIFNRDGGFSVDLSKTSALGLMAVNPNILVKELSLMFMHGQMPAGMQAAIVNRIQTISDPAARVRIAIYLVVTSSLYKVDN